MDNYCELVFAAEESVQDVLIAELFVIGYDGFEQNEAGIKAYIVEETFSEISLNILVNKYRLKYSKSIIHKQNWNKLWESNFEPVQVGGFVGIRAFFHPPFEAEVAHEIIITPKMSFGTGHHATTFLMIQLMEELSLTNQSVCDFGTGTGILAILAEKLGAGKIHALDNDSWCIENASENIIINQCKNIDIQRVDFFQPGTTYNIILANINKNIILDNLKEMRNSLEPDGSLLLSGLLEADEKDILEACHGLNLDHKKTLSRNGWIALWFF